MNEYLDYDLMDEFELESSLSEELGGSDVLKMIDNFEEELGDIDEVDFDDDDLVDFDDEF